MPVHIPGEPANATTEGFDWDHPLNRLQVAKFRETLDIIGRCRALAYQEVDSVDNGDDLLKTTLARELDLLVNLPPFPLPGALAAVGLWDLTVFLAFWQRSIERMNETITVQVPVPTTVHPSGFVPVTSTILKTFRRIMSGVGTW